MLPVRIFVPNAAGLNDLWKKFDEHRDKWNIDFPADPISFTVFIAAENNTAFMVNEHVNDEGYIIASGVFLFADITPGEGCFCHIFMWEKVSPKDLIVAARKTIAAVMKAHKLRRVNGLTPVNKPEALNFALRVGFIKEGTIREALPDGNGGHIDGWLTGLIRSDMKEIMEAPDVVE